MAYPQVVRVFATTQDPDFDSPWQMRAPRSSTGSGVVIAGGILTGAHVVANATFLQVQKLSSPDKATARVRAVSHDSDLALLEIVEPADFLADVAPAEIGDMPRLRDEVAVVGYPVGGEEISITEGVVSRVEVQRYSHSQRQVLAVTVDAAINAGNSGGPVFSTGEHGGKVVGIAFQKMQGVDNIGEMVPPPVLRWFLGAAAGGRDLELPAIGVLTQNLENPLLRKQLGLAPGQRGVSVIEVDHSGSAEHVLRPRDVITAIDGLAIANNGTVSYLTHFRTRFDVALVGHCVGDTLRLELIREGQPLSVEVVLRRYAPLVPRSRYDRPPSYFVYGGLVFQTLTRDFLSTWAKWWNKAPKEFLYHYYYGGRTPDRHEVVILTQILADELNLGYGHLYNESIVAVNGVMPRDLASLVATLAAATGVVELRTSTGGLIMFDTDEVRRKGPQILERYQVPFDRSLDLRRG
ncbi:MAG: trypsin-like peptidase domain-containing protein [Kofleriaceae bacterium]|jgi:S1-C subfamily serine protease|nr:trypsin-like peptidase domain-containing protein [Kofleriaceae bacterium]MBP6840874.1 trypsin-like peptidase domain-containing protein [Kofleriaceae bacterium]MBP9204703.1 trypsin-like peptidase domain-containing protein [Kofleriaceae bacterium]